MSLPGSIFVRVDTMDPMGIVLLMRSELKGLSINIFHPHLLCSVCLPNQPVILTH